MMLAMTVVIHYVIKFIFYSLIRFMNFVQIMQFIRSMSNLFAQKQNYQSEQDDDNRAIKIERCNECSVYFPINKMFLHKNKYYCEQHRR